MRKSELSRKIRDGRAPFRDLEIEDEIAGMVRGGIDTVPLPERTISTSMYESTSVSLKGGSTVMIGTWPTPESPLTRTSIQTLSRG